MNRTFMENVGPVNGSQHQKSGTDFVNELFASDNESDAELEEGYERVQTATNGEQSSSDLNQTHNSSTNVGKSKKGAKFPKETAEFKETSHDIILNLSKFTLRNIIMLICDEAGFLLEQKLVHLLQPLEKNEQSMVKLDSIFKALGVETEQDVRLLAQYFINHRQYKDLIKNKVYIQKLDPKSESGTLTSNEDGKLTSSNTNLESQNQLTLSTSAKTVPTDSIQLVDPNEVVTALKTFVTLHHKSEGRQKLAKFRLTNMDNRDDSADQVYWEKYENLIDPKKEKLWDAMLYALEKY